MNMPNSTEQSPWDLNPTQRIVANRGELGIREVVFPKEEHTTSAKWSSLKTYIPVTLYRLNRWFRKSAPLGTPHQAKLEKGRKGVSCPTSGRFTHCNQEMPNTEDARIFLFSCGCTPPSISQESGLGLVLVWVFLYVHVIFFFFLWFCCCFDSKMERLNWFPE